MTDWRTEHRTGSVGLMDVARGTLAGLRSGHVTAGRAGALCAAIGLALMLPGCAAGSLQGLSAQTPITAGAADVQTNLRAEAKRLVQPLPAARPQAASGFTLGGMLDVLVNGKSKADMAAEREAAKTPDGPQAAAKRYLAARGGMAHPDLAAIEADLSDKALNAVRFNAAARAVLTWHGQLRASFYHGDKSEADGAKLSALIERDKAVISRTYGTLTEQAAVLAAAVKLVRGRMDPARAQRVKALSVALKASVSRLGVLSGQGHQSDVVG